MEFKIIKYTNEDIIKAAILCANGDHPTVCQECPMNNKNCGEVMVKAVAEILKNQKEDNERLYNENEALISAQESLQKYVETQIAEAIKEFAERVKEYSKCYSYVTPRDIDNLVKEMVGDK